jgi:flotillin
MTGSICEPASPLVAMFERAGVRRNDELMRMLQRVHDKQRAGIEAFKVAETERAGEEKLTAERALADDAEGLATSEARLRELGASPAEVKEGDSAREVAACEAAVAEAESLAQAAREVETRVPRAREPQGAALDGARGATARATAGSEAERAAATAKAAATEAAELIRDADRLSAEARAAEQQAVASARALESPGSAFVDEVSALAGDDEIDLTDVDADEAGSADSAVRGEIEHAGEERRGLRRQSREVLRPQQGNLSAPTREHAKEIGKERRERKAVS